MNTEREKEIENHGYRNDEKNHKNNYKTKT